MPPVIRELSKSMINKIAAGEVVERPANVVKELVENSIDAGAKRIVVDIKDGGMTSIKISDDGCGIPADQLLLALSPHSTSKLSEPDDLFKIHTLGFRGEALASIAEITHLTLTSRPEDVSEGATIECNGSERGEIRPVSRAVGTTIEARDIFFNVPARRKFLKSANAEFGHIQEAIVRLAIPNPDVAFVLTHNGRTVYDLPANESDLNRLRRLFKDDVASRLVPVESRYKDIRIGGFVGKPELFKSTSKMQYLFLNKRYIRDNSLSHAIREAYRGLLENAHTTRYPVVFLSVNVPVDFVDFNVHPTKMEVRFVDSQGIYAGLLGAIRGLFLRTDMTERLTDAELASAAARSKEAIDRNRGGNALTGRFSDTAEQARRPGNPYTSASDDGPRLVPEVDPNDPSAACDQDLVERKRRQIADEIKAQRDRKAAERESDDATLDQARYDIEAANAALAEAAELDARDAAAKPAVDEFKKFPPLSSASSNTATGLKLRDLDEIRAARTDAWKRAHSDSGAPATTDAQDEEQDATPTAVEETRAQEIEQAVEKDVEQETTQDVTQDATQDAAEVITPKDDLDPAAVEAPTQVRSPESEYEQTLLDRITANNAHLIEGKTLWTNRVAFDSHGKPVVQMCNRYLVMEAPDGVALIDQHALHERILFERVKANMEAGELDAQRLLVPEIVDLPPTDLAMALDNKQLFKDLGVEFDEFGGTSVIMNSYPAILRALPPREIFTSILEAIRDRRGGALTRAEMLDFAIKQTACKAAIKAGEATSPEAVAKLIAEAEKEVNFHHCPHGRPSTVVLTCDQIDKFFKR